MTSRDVAVSTDPDEENLTLVQSVEQVDRLNADFYGRYPYPWQPATFSCVADPLLHTRLLNQSLGDFTHRRVRDGARIWIAGCGTNQAVFVALRFPHATVVGSDVSSRSLELCEARAREFGLTNLELRQESLNTVTYRHAFDVVVSTGVIHHNASPQRALQALADALASGGVLELMVYNRFHRLVNHSIQKAVRLLAQGSVLHDPELELALVRRLVTTFDEQNIIGHALREYRHAPEADVADALVQPVEHSYTVSSLDALARACGLELLLPCLDEHSASAGKADWTLAFADDRLREAYTALDDVARWQLANLLLFERSPMLWFYLQAADGARPRVGEVGVNERFLDSVFRPVRTEQRSYLRGAGETYVASARSTPFPTREPGAPVRRLVAEADGRRTMRELFARCGVPLDFATVSRARMRLTTPAFPFLVAASA